MSEPTMSDSRHVMGGNANPVALLNSVMPPAIGLTGIKTVIPTVQTGAYTAGFCVGGKITLDVMRTDGAQGCIQSLLVVDKSNTKPTLYALIFGDNPAAATMTDKAAFHFNGEQTKLLRMITIPGTGAWVTIDGIAICDVPIQAQPVGVIPATGTSLYVVLVAGSSVPTFVSASDLLVGFSFFKD